MTNNSVLANIITHKLLLDNTQYQSKPTDIGAINNRIVNHPKDIDIIEFSNQITTPNGKSWIPAYLEGARKNDAWKSQSVFALDFDNKNPKTKSQVASPLSFEQVLERLKDYGLDCAFAYTTFSHADNWHKYRVVFQINEPVVDKGVRDAIQNALMIIFPECDKGCKDASRIFFGGKDIIYTDYDYYLDLGLLFQAADFYAIKDSSSKNMKRDLTTARKNMGVRKIEANTITPIFNNIEKTVNASKIKTVDNVDWDELRKQIKILDDFMNPDIKLLDPQLLGLVTNLIYLSGGQDLYEKCLRANPDYNYKEKIQKLHYCKTSDYLPMRLEHFSPYQEDWCYLNLLNTIQKKKIVRLKQFQGMPIETARQLLIDTLKTVIATQDNYIHIFKVATGLGKTTACMNLSNVLFALPTHDLKNDVSVLMHKEQLLHRFTPSDEMLPKEVKDRLSFFYVVGANAEATRYLKEMSEIYPQVNDYRLQNRSCYKSTETVLTTHQKALFIDWGHNTIIFDEDIFQVLLPIEFIDLADLLRLESKINNTNDKVKVTALINDIREGKVNTPRIMDLIFEDLESIRDEVLNNPAYNSPILHFFNASYFQADNAKSGDITKIRFISNYTDRLPQDKKIIIMSATADEASYKCLFGDRIKFYDISNVDTIGFISQDTTYSLSHSSLNERLNYMTERLKENGQQTITFKSYGEYFMSKGVDIVEDIYFYNCTGRDKLKGKNINVVGTPHRHPIEIALYAKVLNLPVNDDDFDIKNFHQQTVEHNGFRFWFNTYNNLHLRNLQFHFIESELIQAVGRARVNTELCTVNLYSNFPLKNACVTDEEKELGLQSFVHRANSPLCDFVNEDDLYIPTDITDSDYCYEYEYNESFEYDPLPCDLIDATEQNYSYI
ncbi:hypothetical protein B9G53_22835 [Pseudanabaena sp. SR411]|uniref:hypothetical protein n=1 Tax=Pseudanabaena sp. SR411 TaxID=1980935 RepID=UPI000B981BBC|nr:hypothetical protein [Pseudanabaena sp. SR411]OYQ62309.1 hypothetical protein B9G53_22835 [Pseudanabaena sp. SR411]